MTDSEKPTASEAQAGWVMVPREPTFEMIAATANGRTTVGDIYRAMLASAPQPASSPVAAEGQKVVLPDHYHDMHIAHCNSGSYAGVCKYGDEVCPALPATPTASMADAAEAVAGRSSKPDWDLRLEGAAAFAEEYGGDDRDWEITCDDCAGTGKVDVSEPLHVDGRYMGDNLMREVCNACAGYGFTVCLADIPKEIQK